MSRNLIALQAAQQRKHSTRDVRGRIRTEDIKKFRVLFEKIVEAEGLIETKKTCNLCSRTIENLRLNKVLTCKMATRILECYKEKFPKK